MADKPSVTRNIVITAHRRRLLRKLLLSVSRRPGRGKHRCAPRLGDGVCDARIPKSLLRSKHRFAPRLRQGQAPRQVGSPRSNPDVAQRCTSPPLSLRSFTPGGLTAPVQRLERFPCKQIPKSLLRSKHRFAPRLRQGQAPRQVGSPRSNPVVSLRAHVVSASLRSFTPGGLTAPVQRLERFPCKKEDRRLGFLGEQSRCVPAGARGLRFAPLVHTGRADRPRPKAWTVPLQKGRPRYRLPR